MIVPFDPVKVMLAGRDGGEIEFSAQGDPEVSVATHKVYPPGAMLPPLD